MTNVYDGFGRLASSTTDMGGASRTLAYHMTPRGNRTAHHPSGRRLLLDYAYDALGRPELIYRARHGSALAGFSLSSAQGLPQRHRPARRDQRHY